MADVSSIRPYVTGGEYDFIKKDVAAFRRADARLVGKLDSRNFQLQSTEESSVVAFVCLVNGKSVFLNADNVDITPKDRKATGTIRLSYKLINGRLLIDQDEAWTTSSVC